MKIVMARIAAVLASALVALALITPTGADSVAGGRAQSVAAVQKVIQMLTDMSAKGKQEKMDEEVAFGKFQTWCSTESANLDTQVKKQAQEIELLTAEVGKLDSDTKGLGEAISKAQSDKAGFESNLQAEKAQREKDHADFQAEEHDFSETVDAIEQALEILSKQDYDRPATAAALVQLSSSQRLPEKARSIVAAFVGMLAGKQDPMGGMDYNAPEANAYEFQSGSIVALLKRLQDEFRDKVATCQKDENNSRHAFDMIVADLTDAAENAQKDAEEKAAEKERKTAKKAEAEKQSAATQAVKADTERTLALMSTECHEKKMSFAEKQQLRAEEIEAIEKAIEILRSPDVLGNAETHLALAQAARPSSATSLLQAGSYRAGAQADGQRAQGVHRRLREFLAAEGQRLHSGRLTLLADKVLADPFVEVKKLLDDMITRLLEETNEDAKHEGFCDTEMGKSSVTRNKLSADIDGLNAAVEDGKADIMRLTEETAQLSKDLAELEQAMGEATAMRVEEKARNAETVRDAKAAQTAIAAATAVLKDFYAKALTATALLQRDSSRAPSPRAYGLKTGVKMGTDEWDALANPNFVGSIDKGHKEDMQTFGERDEGQQDEARYGVLGLLEVIASDFANLEADTSAAEATAAEAHERFMVESQQSKAVKQKKVNLNQADQAAAEAKLQEDTADFKSTQDELLAADRYYEKLAPQCTDQGMTWEQRVAARQAEIDSLKEALKILSGSDIA